MSLKQEVEQRIVNQMHRAMHTCTRLDGNPHKASAPQQVDLLPLRRGSMENTGNTFRQAPQRSLFKNAQHDTPFCSSRQPV